VARGRDDCGQHAANRLHRAVERQFAEQQHVFERP
jgi:hypothetical protein